MKRYVLVLGVGVGLLSSAVVGYAHNVSTVVYPEDGVYIERMLDERGYGHWHEEPPKSFDEEIAAILAVQDAVLSAAPIHQQIPEGQSREPRDLYEAGFGWCHDRSRAIEKGLEFLGFEVRHLAIYEVYASDSALHAVRALLTPGINSHAVTEVLTEKGWLVVDSNNRWISLTDTGEPVAVDDIYARQQSGTIWSPRNRRDIDTIFTRPFVHVYGLYSRHGAFFPPMTPVPDVNWVQLLYNFV